MVYLPGQPCSVRLGVAFLFSACGFYLNCNFHWLHSTSIGGGARPTPNRQKSSCSEEGILLSQHLLRRSVVGAFKGRIVEQVDQRLELFVLHQRDVRIEGQKAPYPAVAVFDAALSPWRRWHAEIAGHAEFLTHGRKAANSVPLSKVMLWRRERHRALNCLSIPAMTPVE